MITQRTISIIITTCHSEKYIGDCLKSLAAQTNPDWMALIMDDGSNDKITKTLKTWAKKDPRIRIFQSENQDESAVYNALLDKVETPYLCFVDGNDLLHPRALAVALDIMECSGADIVEYGIAQVSEATKPADVATELPRFTADWDKGQQKQDEWISMENKLYRVARIKGIRLISELIYNDALWFNTLAHDVCRKKMLVNVPLYFGRKTH